MRFRGLRKKIQSCNSTGFIMFFILCTGMSFDVQIHESIFFQRKSSFHCSIRSHQLHPLLTDGPIMDRSTVGLTNRRICRSTSSQLARVVKVKQASTKMLSISFQQRGSEDSGIPQSIVSRTDVTPHCAA